MTSSSQVGKFQVTDLHCDKSSMCGFHSLSSHCPCSHALVCQPSSNWIFCPIWYSECKVFTLFAACSFPTESDFLTDALASPRRRLPVCHSYFPFAGIQKDLKDKWVSPILTYLIVKADLSAHKHSILDLVGVTLSSWHIGIHGAFTQSPPLSNNPKILDNYHLFAEIISACNISSPRGSSRSHLTLFSPI